VEIGISKKLQAPWQGPYVVTEVLSPVLFRLSDRKRSLVIHHDKLKLCSDRSFPSWLLRLRQEVMETEAGESLLPQESSTHDLRDDLGLEMLFGSNMDDQDAEGTESSDVEDQVPEVLTNRGRAVRKPARFLDFDMN